MKLTGESIEMKYLFSSRLREMSEIYFQGIWQLPVFFGQVLPHLCHAENNTIQEKYIEPNATYECDWDCSMKTSYVNDFGMICDDAHLQPYVLTFILATQVVGGLVSGHVMDKFGRRLTTVVFGLGSLCCILDLFKTSL